MISATAIKAWFVAHPVARGAALVGGGLLLGAGLGHVVHPRMVTVTKTDSKSQEQLTRLTTENAELSEQLTRTQNQLVELQSMRVTTTHTVKAPGGTVVTDTVTKVESHEQVATQKTEAATKEATQTVNVDESAIKNTDTFSTKTTEPLPDPRFLAIVGVGVLPLQGASAAAMLSFQARVLGPVYVGAWAVLPLSALTYVAVGLDVGVRFGQ